MFIEAEITVPPGTQVDSPIEKIIPITRGVIKRIDIDFPRGCSRTVGIQIYWGKTPIMPVNPDEWVKADETIVSGEFFHYIYQPPFILTAFACSPEANYEHKIRIRVNILPLWTQFPFSDELYRLVTMDEQRIGR